MYTLSTDKKLAVLSALVEGNSIRSTNRMTGVDRNTITSLLLRTGDHCADLMDGSMRNLRCGFVQCDEIWTFVGKKQRHVKKDDSPELATSGYSSRWTEKPSWCLSTRSASARRKPPGISSTIWRSGWPIVFS